MGNDILDTKETEVADPSRQIRDLRQRIGILLETYGVEITATGSAG